MAMAMLVHPTVIEKMKATIPAGNGVISLTALRIITDPLCPVDEAYQGDETKLIEMIEGWRLKEENGKTYSRNI